MDLGTILVAGSIVGGMISTTIWSVMSYKKEELSIKKIKARGKESRSTMKAKKKYELESQALQAVTGKTKAAKTNDVLTSILDKFVNSQDDEDLDEDGVEGMIGKALKNPLISKMAEGYLSGLQNKKEDDETNINGF